MNSASTGKLGRIPGLLAAVTLLCGCATHRSGRESDPLVLRLATVEDRVVFGRSVTVDMTLENRSGQRLSVVRPPSSRTVERCWSWGGYRLEIRGPTGVFKHIPLPRPVPPVSRAEIVTLGPGQSVNSLIDIGGCISGDTYRSARLRHIKGEYTVIAWYEPRKEILGRAGDDMAAEPLFWEGAVRSEVLRFELQAE